MQSEGAGDTVERVGQVIRGTWAVKRLSLPLLFLLTVAGIFCGAIFGLGGASVVADHLFGVGALSSPASYHSLSTALAMAALVYAGMIVGAVGVLATLVLPLHFAFPAASRRFWAGVTPDRGISRWYFRRLQELVPAEQRRVSLRALESPVFRSPVCARI
jgi:hypothetical protein